MGGGGSKPADVYKIDGYQIATADGRQCLRVDPNKVVENADENVKHTSLGLAWGSCNPDDPWQIWNAKEDGYDNRQRGTLGKPGDYFISSARYVNTPGKISVNNVGVDGTKRFLYAECVSSLVDQNIVKCTTESDPFVKWFPDDYDPQSGYFTNVYYKSKYRHWEIFKTDSGDATKVIVKYFINDSQAEPNLYANVCISKNTAGKAVLTPCVPAEYLLFEPKGRKTDPVVQQAPPGPGPNAAEWTANVPTPAPGPAPPLTDASPTQAPAPETSALAPAPSALSSPAPSAIPPPSYYDVAPSPAVEENWWKKNQTMLLIGGGVLLCLCVFMIVAFMLFM